MTTMLDAALAYARRGWHIFPCRPRAKEPLTEHGHKDATTDEATIRRWWQTWPNANIGIACDQSGLVVIDVDGRHDGHDAWSDLVLRLGLDDETVRARSGSGDGLHLYYRKPEGITIRGGAGKLGNGVDVKTNGYVVAPPSVHPFGGRYAWEPGFSPDDLEPKPLPEALVSLLAEPNGHRQQEPAAGEGGKVPEGGRNVWLTSVAGSLRRRGLPQEALEVALHVVNQAQCDPPLPDEEVARIAASVARYAPDEDALRGDGADLQKDYGHAAFLSRLFLNRYRWAVHLGKWLEYADGVWRPVPEERAAKVASEALRAEYARLLAIANGKDEVERWTQAVKDTCYYARMVGALAFLKGWDGILTYPHEWDANPWLLNVQNGTVDLRTLELRPHDPADLLTKQAPVRYEPQARSARWEAHVNRFLPNPNIRRQVQRDLGMALVGATLDEVLPIWYGEHGANGKSTTARVIMGVLGDYAIRAAPNLLVQSRYEAHPTGLADLAGRRVVFSIEVDEGRRLAEALVKDLTGGDRKKARHMRQDFFEFEQTFSIFLLVNHKPVITGTDGAIWRRIRLVPWEYRIPEHERRPQDEVVAELVAEGSAVLNWLLAGLADWLHDHHWVAPEVQAATEAYRLEQDVLGAFLGECCELGPRYTVEKGALYDAYTKWCADAGEEPVGKTRFGSLLRQRGMGEARAGHGGPRKWVGLRLNTSL